MAGKKRAVRFASNSAVIYARYSSDNQREASIEDQVRECRQWAEDHEMDVVCEYCDYAISGRTDERPQFQRMIADAEKGKFSAVIMYQTSRFARNRHDAAIYKHRLKMAGVSIYYTAFSIPIGPEGIILESLMEGMDEYYSANLSINIKRGQRGNALKAIAMHAPPIGLRINSDHMYEPDPLSAPHVLKAFQMLDEGRMQKEVLEYFNSLGLKTSKGGPFTSSSLKRFWTCRKYIGEYSYSDTVLPDAIEPIIPLDLFERVQIRIAANQHSNGGKAKSMVDFILTGKLFCGHCSKAMIGTSGTSKTAARKHYYYSCVTRKREHACKKANERRTALEIAVVNETVRHVLQPDVINALVDAAMKIQLKDQENDPVLKTLEAEHKAVTTSLKNLLRAIEDGLYTPTTKKRMEELEKQQSYLASQIKSHSATRPVIEREQLQFFLESFRDGDPSDPEYRRKVIETLVHSVTVTDIPATDDDPTLRRRLRIAYNLSKNNVSVVDFDSAQGSDALDSSPLVATQANPLVLYYHAGVFVLDVTIKVPV